MSFLETGDLTIEELRASSNYPSEARLSRGPCIVIECIQDIPCNPCETICPRSSIKIGDPITNLPRFDAETCNGCGVCLAICPGQAIFLLDKTFSEDRALVSFPYEYLPCPEKGSIVDAVDRSGKVISKGEVVRVLNPKKNDRTPVITIAIPKAEADVVRSIRRGSWAASKE